MGDPHADRYREAFYAARQELRHDDPRDDRPGFRISEVQLHRLVTTKVNPKAEVPDHARALRRAEQDVHNNMHVYPASKEVGPMLRQRIRDKLALQQELTEGLVELPPAETRMLHNLNDDEGGLTNA